MAPPLERSLESVAIPASAGGLPILLRVIGPAYLVAVGYTGS